MNKCLQFQKALIYYIEFMRRCVSAMERGANTTKFQPWGGGGLNENV